MHLSHQALTLSVRSVLAGVLLNTSMLLAADKVVDGRSDSSKEVIATSFEELNQLACRAIDDENYGVIRQLMAPTSLLAEIGASKEKQKDYEAYIAEIEELAIAYRAYLKEQKLLPLSNKILRMDGEGSFSPKEVPGKTVLSANGHRLLSGEKKFLIEFIDQSLAVDGRWYITRFCIENIEKKLVRN